MSEPKTKKYNISELQQFDGADGHPLYVAYKGRIYDFSNSKLWLRGKHMNVHTRDENLAEAIKGAPHGEDNVFRFPLVGEFDAALQIPPPPVAKPVAPQVSQPEQTVNLGRRNFLKLTAAAGGAVTVIAIASAIKAGTFVPKAATQEQWPTVKIANISQLTKLTPVTFYYPLTNTPNILVKLGVKATNGVGPDGDIVAFSDICQHLGCLYSFVLPGGSPVCNASYKAPMPMGYCCCHGSQYDFVNGATVIGGPAPRPVPPVTLKFDSTTGDISAVGMGPPTIFGHGPPGTTDAALVMQYDLQGGTIVTQDTVMTG